MISQPTNKENVVKSLSAELKQHSLQEAIEDIRTQIKASPTKADLRAHLVQLLCLQGQWDLALKQLQPWQALTPIAEPTITLLSQLIEGEKQRLQVFSAQRLPSLITSLTPWLELLVKAIRHDVNGETEQAFNARNQAYELAPTISGTITIQQKGEDETSYSFNWLTDGDNRFGPICELIVNGKYCWLPFNDIQEIRFQEPVSATDLLWRHVCITLMDGQQRVCQIPARYPLTPEQNDQLLIGHRTEWLPLDNDNTYYHGIGQRMYISDEQEYPILELKLLTFDLIDQSME